MKRRFLCALAAACALAMGAALAEGGLTGALAASSPSAEPASSPTAEPTSTPSPAPTAAPTPTATPEPAGVEFAADGLRILLPEGMEILSGDALEAYEAAVQFDFPGAGRTIFAAADPKRGAAAIAAEVESSAGCLDAAQEAAEALIGDSGAASEARFGENEGASFACAIQGQPYRLYFFSDGKRLIVLGFTGLEPEEIEELLAGLELG